MENRIQWRKSDRDDNGKVFRSEHPTEGKELVGREKDMIATAEKYAYSIFNIARTELDRSKLARTLWETCAMPSILYATEAFSVSNKTVKGVNKTKTGTL